MVHRLGVSASASGWVVPVVSVNAPTAVHQNPVGAQATPSSPAASADAGDGRTVLLHRSPFQVCAVGRGVPALSLKSPTAMQEPADGQVTANRPLPRLPAGSA